jgi:hypothetical protein
MIIRPHRRRPVHNRRFFTAAPALMVFVAAVIALFAAPYAVRAVRLSNTAAQVTLARQRVDSEDILRRLSEAVADLAAAVSPSVVHIDAGSAAERLTSVFTSDGAGGGYDESGHFETN